MLQLYNYPFKAAYINNKFLREIQINNHKIVTTRTFSIDDVLLAQSTSSKSGQRITLETGQVNEKDWTKYTLSALTDNNIKSFKTAITLERYKNGNTSTREFEYQLTIRLKRRRDNKTIVEIPVRNNFYYLGKRYLATKCTITTDTDTYFMAVNWESSTSGWENGNLNIHIELDTENNQIICITGSDDYTLRAPFKCEPCYIEIEGECSKMRYYSGNIIIGYVVEGVGWHLDWSAEYSKIIDGYDV